MDLKSFLLQLPKQDRESFASRCGTSYGHLRNVAYGGKTCAETLALSIERESGGKVPLDAVRPDLKRQLDASGYVKASPQEAA